ncbi:MAG: nucleotide sugar dehydrogenase [Chloroflexi bacterium]|nr:nucleotide sugar dehydrogenase [Chloroflexota bacterium]
MSGSRRCRVLEQKIADRSASVAVVGLGYVGLPLAVGFARAGFSVTGIDIDAGRVRKLVGGESYIPDVPSDDVRSLVERRRLWATTNPDALIGFDVAFICVPTPFTPTKAPDISYIESAARTIAQYLRAGKLVMLQSTTHPGTTEEVVQPILEARSGLLAGRDFHLAFCPERINPGDQKFTVENTPKVVGGLTPACTQVGATLMATLGAPVHTVSSPRAAEMAKLLENIFRNVNIALVNELAKLAERMGIDIWEVIGAASTKPFGFMPFYPGAGVGGHCIPVDPYYLSWKAREYDFYTRFIELAAEVNQSMPYHTVERVVQALATEDRALRGARMLVLGVAFKKDIDDARNSVAERVIELLLQGGADVQYNDPYVPQFSVGGNVFFRRQVTMESQELSDELLEQADCVVIVSGHSAYDYGRIVRSSRLVVDTCNATRSSAGHVFKIGVPPAHQPVTVPALAR